MLKLGFLSCMGSHEINLFRCLAGIAPENIVHFFIHLVRETDCQKKLSKKQVALNILDFKRWKERNK